MVVQDEVLQDQVQRGQLLLGRGHPEKEAGGGVVLPGQTRSTHIFIYNQLLVMCYI